MAVDLFLSLKRGLRVEPESNHQSLDCRLLFAGDRVRQLVRTYQEIVHRLSQPVSPKALSAFVHDSAEIAQTYEISDTPAGPRLTLRDAWFRTQVNLEGLPLTLKVADGQTERHLPLSLDRLLALGVLLPQLGGDCTESQIAAAITSALSGPDLAWARSLLVELLTSGFVERAGEPTPNRFREGDERPRVTFVAHTSLLVETAKTAVLFDPLFPHGAWGRAEVFDVARLPLGAICLSHSHWDHCDVATLLRFDKRTPILVPRVVRPTLFNPPIVPMLRRLGFTDVREVEHWRAERIEDVEIIPVPFHGEQDEPDAEIDHYTYVVRSGDWCFYGGVDAFRDSGSDMRADLERVRRDYAPTLAFLPVSQMVYEYRHGGVNGFCRLIDPTLLDQSFQYTAGPEVALDWTRLLGVRLVAPYATFTFDPRTPSPEAVRFGEVLSAAGLGDAFVALAPLDRLTRRDLQPTSGAARRRATLRRRLERTATLGHWERRLNQSLVYRGVRRILGTKPQAAAEHHH